AARTGRRGALRPRHRKALPPRDPAGPLAAGQGPPAVPLRPDRPPRQRRGAGGAPLGGVSGVSSPIHGGGGPCQACRRGPWRVSPSSPPFGRFPPAIGGEQPPSPKRVCVREPGRLSPLAMSSHSPAVEAARRRTFAIISHPDAGKTTLTENLLLAGGAIRAAGQVRARGENRRTRSDWMKIERERGISVSASVMTF